MRPLVSYDDISAPASGFLHQPPEIGTHDPPARPPPAKKRKKNQRNKPRREQPQQPQQRVQHWDDPGNPDASMSYGYADGNDFQEEEWEDGEEEDESRELTQQEIWDDSALIEAWNAATEEYEAYNGPDKGWKNGPVNKSPLWYNVPYTQKDTQKAEVQESPGALAHDASLVNNITNATGEADSQPVNFDTFVPNHDPTLDMPVPHHPPPAPADFSSHYLPQPPGPLVSMDEAFSRALGAMYWGGYWTAVYHCQRSASVKRPARGEDVDEQEESNVEEEDSKDDEGKDSGEFLSTQR
ncbi:hypothetical protein PLICRDRAFT_165108 [Plicaturopsis crispa FD-325 SS-3]|nr:hypothetical protein PLICRDRAFT_165108 [Plicaturopsis crispa FD-325 SS-3]